MEWVTTLLTFLEKHIRWRNILFVMCVIVAFWLGYKYNDAVRDKRDAELINSHTKEIKAYCDSAQAAKHEAHDVINNYKWMMFYQNRTIDSLKNIIESRSNENKD